MGLGSDSETRRDAVVQKRDAVLPTSTHNSPASHCSHHAASPTWCEVCERVVSSASRWCFHERGPPCHPQCCAIFGSTFAALAKPGQLPARAPSASLAAATTHSLRTFSLSPTTRGPTMTSV